MRSLQLLIENAGFPPGYAKAFVNKFQHKLDRLEEADRLIVEAFIPDILTVGEDCWLIPADDSGRSKNDHLQALINAVLDPSMQPQQSSNRE